MKHLVVFVSLLMVPCVNAQDLDDCTKVAQLYTFTPFGDSCPYYEDAVMCGINMLDLLNDNVSNETIQTGRTWANKLLGDHQCNTDFDDIFDVVNAAPQLLKLQECIRELDTVTVTDQSQICSIIEEAVKCAIQEMGLYKEDASDSDMKFAREAATRYLSPVSCPKTFDDILTEVKVVAVAEPCLRLAQFLIPLNPVRTCAYTEDAVRCGIDDLDLYSENTTVNEANLEYVMNTANLLLSQSNCPKSFEAIFDEIKLSPQLLKLQQYYATALDKGLQNLTESCSYVEEAVTCGIETLELHQENSSDEMMLFGREMATRYLEPFNCNKTFDEIFDELKYTITTEVPTTTTKDDGNSSSTASAFGWLTAMMVVFIVELKTDA